MVLFGTTRDEGELGQSLAGIKLLDRDLLHLLVGRMSCEHLADSILD